MISVLQADASYANRLNSIHTGDIRDPADSLRADVASDSDISTLSKVCSDFILAITLNLNSIGWKTS